VWKNHALILMAMALSNRTTNDNICKIPQVIVMTINLLLPFLSKVVISLFFVIQSTSKMDKNLQCKMGS
jgi:hypothetical protein